MERECSCNLNPYASSLAAVFCTLNSTSGAYYHIGYPAIARIAFGMNGSYFAVLNRILLSVVWCEPFSSPPPSPIHR